MEAGGVSQFSSKRPRQKPTESVFDTVGSGSAGALPVGTKQVPGVAPPATPYFFSLPERSRQEKAPHRLARCAGSLRPADIWRSDKNSLRSNICPPLSPNVHRAPATAKGGKPTPQSQRSAVGAALVAPALVLNSPPCLRRTQITTLPHWRCSRCIEKLLESMVSGQGFVGEGQGEGGCTSVKTASGNWRREQRVEKLRQGGR